jgi:hypothetical protein
MTSEESKLVLIESAHMQADEDALGPRSSRYSTFRLENLADIFQEDDPDWLDPNSRLFPRVGTALLCFCSMAVLIAASTVAWWRITVQTHPIIGDIGPFSICLLSLDSAHATVPSCVAVTCQSSFTDLACSYLYAHRAFAVLACISSVLATLWTLPLVFGPRTSQRLRKYIPSTFLLEGRLSFAAPFVVLFPLLCLIFLVTISNRLPLLLSVAVQSALGPEAGQFSITLYFCHFLALIAAVALGFAFILYTAFLYGAVARCVCSRRLSRWLQRAQLR